MNPGAGGWSPLDTDRYQWLQIDLGSRKQVVAIATQGRYSSSDWTSQYRLLYSDTQNNWRPYLQDGNIWVRSLLCSWSDIESLYCKQTVTVRMQIVQPVMCFIHSLYTSCNIVFGLCDSRVAKLGAHVDSSLWDQCESRHTGADPKWALTPRILQHTARFLLFLTGNIQSFLWQPDRYMLQTSCLLDIFLSPRNQC